MIIENAHPTGNQSLIVQAMASISLLVELSNANFLNSEYFEKMHFDNESYKGILKQSGIGNPAVMHFALYAYLVIPKEILKREGFYLSDGLYKGLNDYIATIVEKESYSTYPNENSLNTIPYCEHIRNAIAHSKSSFEVENGVSYVKFIDERYRDNCRCEIKLKTMNVGEIIARLSDILTVYLIETLK